jgi:hypothetical protein
MIGVFLGINSSKTGSRLGYCSCNFVRMARWTEDLSCDCPAMFSEKLNLSFLLNIEIDNENISSIYFLNIFLFFFLKTNR